MLRLASWIIGGYLAGNFIANHFVVLTWLSDSKPWVDIFCLILVIRFIASRFTKKLDKKVKACDGFFTEFKEYQIKGTRKKLEFIKNTYNKLLLNGLQEYRIKDWDVLSSEDNKK